MSSLLRFSDNNVANGAIMVIEDNLADARLVQIYLSETSLKGYRVDVFDRLSKGIDALGKEEYVLVLLDLTLPDSRGFETLERLLDTYPDANVVVMTGHSDTALGLKSIKYGAQDFIVKGDFGADKLEKTLRFATERHKVIRSLEQAQRLAHIANWEWDFDSQKVKASEELFRQLGRPITAPLDVSWVHPDDVAAIFTAKAKAKARGKASADIRFMHLDGSVRFFFIEGTATYRPDGSVQKLVGIAQDITDRKSAENEIVKAQERYRSVFNQSQDAIYIVRMDGTFVDFNEATVNLLGYDKKELKNGFNIIQVYKHPQQRQALLTQLERSGSITDMELEIVRKDGSVRHCLLSATKIMIDTGEEVSQAIIRDVTVRRQAAELMRAKELAERSAQMKENFLARVSHEIRTPMNAILGMSNLILKTDLDQEQESFASSIKLASENLLKIINDILEVSQIQSGKITFETREFDLHELLKGIFQISLHRANEKGLELKLDLPDSVDELVVGDPIRLNQILLNLLTNAIKYTDKGNVELLVRKEAEDGRHLRLLFEVKDTGEGIDANKLDSIFEMFVQVSGDIRKSQGGTGVGLAIVKQLVELQNGDIEVVSDKEKGSVFTVRLNFLKPGTHTKPVDEVLPDTSRPILEREIHILLAEDHKLNQIVAKKTIQGEWANTKLTIVENGLEAVNALKSGEVFDLILMDLQMPEMDGYEATRIIRDELGLKLPILAMTAHAHIGQDDKYLEQGFDDYVLKPFQPHELFVKLVKYLKNLEDK